MALGWLPDGSVDSIRSALDQVAPDMAVSDVVLLPWVEQSNPIWWRRSARLNGDRVVKFAWSKPAAERVWHEAQVLEVLDSDSTMRTPRLIASSSDPVLLVTEWVEGTPLTYNHIAVADRSWLERAADEMALFLSGLHRPQVLAKIEGTMGSLMAPEPQATTEVLRRRLSPWVRADQARLIPKWCDWVDRTLSSPQTPVFVQGDLHGHNQVWDLLQPALRLVVDFEESGATDAAYDFRYLPSQGPGIDFLVANAASYAEISGYEIDLDRVMAWNVRTVLGDALWRSEARVPLPDGGTPSEWVDGLYLRLAELGIPN